MMLSNTHDNDTHKEKEMVLYVHFERLKSGWFCRLNCVIWTNET